MDNSDDRSLLEEMDAAARELVQLILKPVDPNDGDILNAPPTLPEKLKLFHALTDYVKWRERPVGTTAPTPPPTKFQLLKGEFNNGRSDKAKGGGNKRDSSANSSSAPPSASGGDED